MTTTTHDTVPDRLPAVVAPAPPGTATRHTAAALAKGGFSLTERSDTFTAIAQDSLGRTDTNTVTAWLPLSSAHKYDLNGNLTNDSRRVLAYDDENQLVSVVVTNAGGTVTKSDFAYDGKLRRRVRWESVLSGGAWVTNLIVCYVYDGMLVIQERHFSPQLSATIPLQLVTYTRGRDLSGSFEGAGGIGGLLARTESSSIQNPASSYYHCDGNGNITCLIGTNSVVLARYLYDPYGNLLSQSGSLAQANLYRFSSKEWHTASGLVYYGYRFYAAEEQRWVSRDPLKEPGFRSVATAMPSEQTREKNYAFVENAPVTRVDLLGLAWNVITCTEWCDKVTRQFCGLFVRNKANEWCHACCLKVGDDRQAGHACVGATSAACLCAKTVPKPW